MPIRPSDESAVDAELIIQPGESATKWQARLRERVKTGVQELAFREAQHTIAIAQLRSEHATAMTAKATERLEIHRRLTETEKQVSDLTASLRRVERDAQLAMQRVLQLEEAIEAQGAVAVSVKAIVA